MPILPIGIAGAHALMPPGAALPRRGRVTVRFGEPYRPRPGHDLDATTAALAARVAELSSLEGELS